MAFFFSRKHNNLNQQVFSTLSKTSLKKALIFLVLASNSNIVLFFQLFKQKLSKNEPN